MKNHTKIYFNFFGFDQGDFIPCEVTGGNAVDISHNVPRGMGGSKKKDVPENLMALTRELHDFLEKNPGYYWWFQLVHLSYMVTRTPYHETWASVDDPIFKEIVSEL